MYIYVRTHAQLCVCAKRALSPQIKVNISSISLKRSKELDSQLHNMNSLFQPKSMQQS